MWQWQYRWVFNPFFGVYQLQLVQVFVPVYPVYTPVVVGYAALPRY